MGNKKNNYCIILAGGVGSRLWPYSRRNKPKQFLDFFRIGRTMLQLTYDRFSNIIPKENIFISTYTEYKSLVEEQLPEVEEKNILFEPVQLSTGPAVAWACFHIANINPNANIIVSPSDQFIVKEDFFLRDVMKGFDFVEKEKDFLALTVKPAVPDTGYGYIQVSEDKKGDAMKVKSFTEKPDLSFAKIFVESGEFYWNTGLFLWNVKTMIEALQFLTPSLEAMAKRNCDGQCDEKKLAEDEVRVMREFYPSSLYVPIDMVILEKCHNVYAACCDFGWVDIGSWTKLYDVLPKDEENNAVAGKSQAMLYDCKNNLVKLDKGKVAVLQGLDGYVVSEKDNILMVCKKDDPSLIRRMLNDARMKLGEDFI